jgi:uncharacterized protein with FMN-binding domain
MRRSTAAAVGTLTGAALIIGVRLSVTPSPAPAASSVNLADATGSADPTSSASKKATAGSSTGKKTKPAAEKTTGAAKNGLKDGVYKGAGVKDPYGTVQVSIKIEGGKITAADATYPTAGQSATINPAAVATLKQETLKSQNADVRAVSGATYTTGAYRQSLQSALDAAK